MGAPAPTGPCSSSGAALIAELQGGSALPSTSRQLLPTPGLGPVGQAVVVSGRKVPHELEPALLLARTDI